MALTEQELTKAKDLKAQGYTNDEILGFLGASRIGQESPIHKEIKQRQEAMFRDDEGIGFLSRFANSGVGRVIAAPGKFLAPEAVDVFGTGLARQGAGTDVRPEVVQAQTEAPTAAQYGAAAVQTAALAADVGITVGSFGAATPWTLGKNVAYGGISGYVYDVTEDIIEQERLAEIIDPDFGTVVGAGAPLAFGALGAAYRGMRPAQEVTESVVDDVGRSVAGTVREAVEPVAPKVSETAKGFTQKAREVAQRVPRAAKRTEEAIQEAAERADLREVGSPQVVNAIDNGLELRTINRVEAPDVPLQPGSNKFIDNDVQRGAYRRVVERAASDNPEQAEFISGEYVAEMYRTVRGKQQEVGQALGKARESLGDAPIPFSEDKRSMMEVLRVNGITLQPDGKVSTRGLTTQEENAIKEIWGQLNKYDLDNLTPKEVNEIDQLLSRMQRQTSASDNLETVYVNIPDAGTGQAVNQNIYSYIRDVFDTRLQQIDTTGEIARLKREYRNLATVTGQLDDVWFSNIDPTKSTDAELAQMASSALRRPDSRAKSGVQYQQIYNRLDRTARANGYKGPNALDVSNFYIKDVNPLYKDTTPPASFQGGIFTGVRQAIGSVIDVGGVTNKDKQRALQELLGVAEFTPTPGTRAGSVAPRGGDSLIESSDYSITPKTGEGGFIRNPFVRSEVADMPTPNIANRNLQVEAREILESDPVADPALLQVLKDFTEKPGRGGVTKTEAAKIIDELKKGKAATPKTTDLLEEARKYPDAESFIEAQGRKVYHGTVGAKTELKAGQDVGLYGKGVYFYDNPDEAMEFVRMTDNPNVIEVVIPKSNLATNDQLDEAIRKAKEEGLPRSEAKNRATQILQEDGFIGIEDEGLFVIFNDSLVKTRTQLEDIWKQANGVDQ